MATTLYFRENLALLNTVNTVAYSMSTTQGSSELSFIGAPFPYEHRTLNSTTSTARWFTEATERDVYVWISPPIASADANIDSGTVIVHANESAMTDNISLGAEVILLPGPISSMTGYVSTSTGTMGEVIASYSGTNSTELSTSASAVSINVGGTSKVIPVGSRLMVRVRIFAYSAGFATILWNSATRNSRLELPINLTFSTEPALSHDNSAGRGYIVTQLNNARSEFRYASSSISYDSSSSATTTHSGYSSGVSATAAGYLIRAGVSNKINKILYSTGAYSTLAEVASSSGPNPVGYYSQSNGYSILNGSITKLSFSTETKTTIDASSVVPTLQSGSGFSSSSVGYMVRGYKAFDVGYGYDTRMPFSTDTVATVGAYYGTYTLSTNGGMMDSTHGLYHDSASLFPNTSSTFHRSWTFATEVAAISGNGSDSVGSAGFSSASHAYGSVQGSNGNRSRAGIYKIAFATNNYSMEAAYLHHNTHINASACTTYMRSFPITGTSSVTLDDFSFSATGSAAAGNYVGTGAYTLDAFTSAATGELGRVGTGAYTLGASSAATGTVSGAGWSGATLYFRSSGTATSGFGPHRHLVTETAGASTSTSITVDSSVGYLKDAYLYAPPYAWVSQPLSAEVYMTDAMTVGVTLYASESNMAADIAIGCEIYAYTYAGVTLMYKGASSVELSSSVASYTFSATPQFTGQVHLDVGDRIVMVPTKENIGAAPGGYQVSLFFDGPDAGTGGSKVSFVTDLFFSAEPSGSADFSAGTGYVFANPDTGTPSVGMTKYAMATDTVVVSAAAGAFKIKFGGAMSPDATITQYFYLPFITDPSGTGHMLRLDRNTDTFSEDTFGLGATTVVNGATVYSDRYGVYVGGYNYITATPSSVQFRRDFVTNSYTQAYIGISSNEDQSGDSFSGLGLITSYSTTQKIDLLFHYVYPLTAALPYSSNREAEDTCSSNHAYRIGGDPYTTAANTQIQSVQIHNHAVTALASAIAVSTHSGAGMKNKNAAYVAASATNSTNTTSADVHKISFATEVYRRTGAALYWDHAWHAGASNFVRGHTGFASNQLFNFVSVATGSGVPDQTVVPRVNHSGDAAYAITYFLALTKYTYGATFPLTASLSPDMQTMPVTEWPYVDTYRFQSTPYASFMSSAAGYFVGGTAWKLSNTRVVKITPAADTLSVLTYALAKPRHANRGVESNYRGYSFGGALTNGGNHDTYICGFHFPTESHYSVSNTLASVLTYSGSGARQSGTHAYLFPNVAASGVKFSFSTDTVSSIAVTPFGPNGTFDTPYGIYLSAPFAQRVFNTGTETYSSFTANFTQSTRNYVMSKAHGYAYASTGYLTGGIKKLAFVTHTLATYDGGLTVTDQYQPVIFTNFSVDGTGSYTLDDVIPWVGPVGYFAPTTLESASSTSNARALAHPGDTYIIAGQRLGSTTNTVDKYSFATNSQSVSTSLFSAITNACGFGDSNRAYSAGGFTSGAETSAVYYLRYDTLVWGVASGTVPTGMWHNAFSSSTHGITHGYYSGGLIGDSSSKIQLSTGTGTFSNAVLNTKRYGGGTFEMFTHGYVCGGTVTGNLATFEVDKYAFATDTAVNVAAALGQARTFGGGVSSPTRGYMCGGEAAGTLYSEIDGIQFSNDSFINPAATLSLARRSHCSGNSYSEGLCFGGEAPIGTEVAEIDGLVFATETATNPAAAISSTRMNSAAGGFRQRKSFEDSWAYTTGDVTSAATGLVYDRVGTGSVTLDAFVSAGSGTATAASTGTGAYTLDALSFSASGSALDSASGTGAYTTAVSSAGNGIVVPISFGSAATTLDNLIAIANGKAFVVGSGSANVSASSQATGSVDIVGTGNYTVSPTFTGNGTVLVVGTGAGSVADVAVSSVFGYVTDYVPADREAKLDSDFASDEPPRSTVISDDVSIFVGDGCG